MTLPMAKSPTTRARCRRGILLALVALLPLQMGFAPEFNIPPTWHFTGAGLDTAYSMPFSDSAEGEWMLGVRAFSIKVHNDDPHQFLWYGGSAELMRGFSSEAYRVGGAIHAGWAFFGAEAGFFTWLNEPAKGSGLHAGLALTAGFVTLYARQSLFVPGAGHFTQFGLRLNAPLHVDR